MIPSAPPITIRAWRCRVLVLLPISRQLRLVSMGARPRTCPVKPESQWAQSQVSPAMAPHGGDTALSQPVGEQFQTGGVRAEGTHPRRQVGSMIFWRGHARRAANVVSASSRDHANQRAPGTRDRSATSTLGPPQATIASAVVVSSRAQVPALEILVPGRQGIRARRDFNPACRSAISLGTTHHGFFTRAGTALSRSLTLSRGGSSVGS
jgi:hypothetical protein